jgi:hypothetical protein
LQRALCAPRDLGCGIRHRALVVGVRNGAQAADACLPGRPRLPGDRLQMRTGRRAIASALAPSPVSRAHSRPGVAAENAPCHSCRAIAGAASSAGSLPGSLGCSPRCSDVHAMFERDERRKRDAPMPDRMAVWGDDVKCGRGFATRLGRAPSPPPAPTRPRLAFIDVPARLHALGRQQKRPCNEQMIGRLASEMATTATDRILSPSDHSAQLRKAVIASTIGTTISSSTELPRD